MSISRSVSRSVSRSCSRSVTGGTFPPIYGAWFDGDSAFMQGGSIAAYTNVDLVMEVFTNDTAFVPIRSDSTEFLFKADSGSTLTTLFSGVGSPTLYIDDVDQTGQTRQQIQATIADGASHTLKATSCDFSTWAAIRIAGYNGIVAAEYMTGVVRDVRIYNAGTSTLRSRWLGDGPDLADWTDSEGGINMTFRGDTVTEAVSYDNGVTWAEL